MRGRELVEIFESVEKAADAVTVNSGEESSAEEDRCLDGLRQLKKFPVNYEILLSTQVGKRLRHFTKHPRKKIQAFASDLIKMWKKIIIEETAKNKKNCSFDSMVSIKAKPMFKETVETKKVRKMNSMKVDKVSKVEHVKLETKNDCNNTVETYIAEKKFENAKFIKTECRASQKCLIVEKATKEEKQAFVASPNLRSVVYCKDATRDKLREILSEALCKVSGEVGETLRDQANKYDPFRVAVSLETAMFKKWGRYNGVHKFKYRSIMFNIKDPKNPDFRREVLLGQVRPEMVLKMTPEEMASKERQLYEKKRRESSVTSV